MVGVERERGDKSRKYKSFKKCLDNSILGGFFLIDAGQTSAPTSKQVVVEVGEGTEDPWPGRW